jgi:hypothetical protein
MSVLTRLELTSRGLIRQAMASIAEAGPDGAAVTPIQYVMMALTADSPANAMMPEEMRVQPGTISVRFAERTGLSKAVSQAVGDVGGQIAIPHSCGHWWILLCTKETSRFCCTRCDLKIEEEAS